MNKESIPLDRPPFDVSRMTNEGRAVVLSTVQLLIFRNFFTDMLDHDCDDHDPGSIAFVTDYIKNIDIVLKINQQAIGKSRMDLLRQQVKLLAELSKQ
jgi:hypothetical protein